MEEQRERHLAGVKALGCDTLRILWVPLSGQKGLSILFLAEWYSGLFGLSFPRKEGSSSITAVKFKGKFSARRALDIPIRLPREEDRTTLYTGPHESRG